MRYPYFLILLLCLACAPDREQKLHEDLEITWELLTNLDPEGTKAQFTFFNSGRVAIDRKDWTLFFSQTNVMPKAQNSSLAVVKHVNGDLFCLEPGESFFIKPGDSLQITYYYDGPMIKNTDAPSGLYFVDRENTGKERASSVENFSLVDFTRPEQINRAENDFVPIPTAESTYAENEGMSLMNLEGRSTIIPSPYMAEVGTELLKIESSLNIVYDEKFEQEANYLHDRLKSFYTSGLEMNSDKKADIRLVRKKALYNDQSKEAYDLTVGPDGIEIRSEETAGIFYGIQSLLAMQREVPAASGVSEISFPYAKINDQPRFGYRGFQLDVGRNFQKKEAVKKLIDVLAYYKINTFLFYLTEDEGWRLEIEGLPELTEVGAQRQHASIDDPALHPSYGSGPKAHEKGTFGSGYYSKEDFIEILQYAHKRHIQVIPEVNLPGHARAAIKAMEKRYLDFKEKGDLHEAERYRLIDPEDRSAYSSAQSFKDNVVCVCRESVYDFYEKVIDVILSYYDEAGIPLQYFHVGGDEVPSGPWTKSPICEEFLKNRNDISGPENLHAYFFKRAVDMLKERGLMIAGWEEVALKKENGENKVNPDFADGNVIPYVWNTLWGAQDLGYKLANAGYPVVLCPVTNFYFDLAYNKDPLEPGLYWAGFVDTRNAYQYAPFDVFKTTTRNDSYYTPIDPAKEFENMERLEASARDRILGVQAQLWSETLKGREMMEYYLLPKLLGFAESAWSKERIWESTADEEVRMAQADAGWNELANRIGQSEFKKLDHLFGGFSYRIPPPGAKMENGFIYANIAYPGLLIRFTTDGSEPDSSSKIYTGPVEIKTKTPIKLKAFNQVGRESRTTILIPLNTNFIK